MKKLSMDELNRVDIDSYKELSKIPLIVVLDNIRSLNNIGAVFRTSDAFLVKSIYLCGITAQPPHKEIHKTALGAEDSVDWKFFNTTKEAIISLKEENFKIYAIEQTDNSCMLQDFYPQENENIAIVLGNEVDGVDDIIFEYITGSIEIPQFGTKHSLNVSVAAGIVIWDIFSKIKK